MRHLLPWLYQGDVSDLNVLKGEDGLKIAEKYGITLAVHVGYMPFVPRGFPTIYLPMLDDPRPKANNWRRVLNVLRLVVDEIHQGGRVLVTCDAGISRSIVFSGMLISVITGQAMNDELMQEIRAPSDEPLRELWKNAENALITWWLR